MPAAAFVGRERELAALGAARAEAEAGRGRVVFLVGEPGIGKTRTVEEALAPVPSERVLWGRCHELDGAPAYWPWAQVLRLEVERLEAAALAEAVGVYGPDLARLVPALAARLPGLAQPLAGSPEQERFHLFDAVASFLRRASQAAPIVLVLDDLHWADRESLLLLNHLAAEIRETRLLVLGTYRDVEMEKACPPSLLVDLARASERIRLAGLSDAEVARFLAPAGGIMPPALARAVHHETGGNPFFVREVMELLLAEARAEHGERASDGVRIPEEAREAVHRRLVSLATDVQSLLAHAAVLGPEFELGALARMVGMTSDEARARLLPAVELGLLLAPATRSGHWSFANAPLRATLRDGLPPAERALVHRRAGEALAAHHRADPTSHLGELAHHFLHAGASRDLARGIDYAIRAGDRALELLGYEEAAGHFQRALEAQTLVGADASARLDVILRLGDAQWRMGDGASARATFRTAAAAARATGDATALARAALGFGAAQAETGRVDGFLVDLLEEAVAKLDTADSALRARLLARLATALYFAANDEQRLALSEEAVTIARRLGHASTLAATLVARHFVLWSPGTAEERLAIASEAMRLAEAAGEPETTCEARAWQILDLLELGETTAADRELETHARMAEDLRLPLYRWHVTLVRAGRALFAGRLAEAGSLAEQALAVRHLGRGNNPLQFYGVQLYTLRREQGRLGEMADAVERLAAETSLPVWRCGLALLHAELGEADAAWKALGDLPQDGFASLHRDANYLPSLAIVAEAASLLRDVRLAEAVYARLAPYARWNIVLGMSAACYGAVSRYLGVAAATAGNVAASVAHFEDALLANARMGARCDLARAQLGLSTTLSARGAPGDLARASELRALAARAADELGLESIRARLDASASHPAPMRGAVAEAVEVMAAIRREGDVWSFAYDGEVVRLRDSKGVGYVLRLLRHPGVRFHASDLAAAREPADSGPGPDASGADAERARLNVGRAIALVLRKIASAHPPLGRHLETTIETGLFCCYTPDPRAPVRWIA